MFVDKVIGGRDDLLKKSLALKLIKIGVVQNKTIGLLVLAEVCITKDDEEDEVLMAKDLSKLELSGNESQDIPIVCRWFATRFEKAIMVPRVAFSIKALNVVAKMLSYGIFLSEKSIKTFQVCLL